MRGSLEKDSGRRKVGGAVSSVQADLSFVRRRKSDGGEPLPGSCTSSGCIDHKLRLDQPGAGAANPPNLAVTTYQFSNHRPPLKSNFRDGCRLPPNDEFKQIATDAKNFETGIKRRSHRTGKTVGLAVFGRNVVWYLPDDSCRAEQPEILREGWVE